MGSEFSTMPPLICICKNGVGSYGLRIDLLGVERAKIALTCVLSSRAVDTGLETHVMELARKVAEPIGKLVGICNRCTSLCIAMVGLPAL